MQNKILILLSIFLIVSCENKEKKVDDINTNIDSTAVALPPPTINNDYNPKEKMDNWVNFYKKHDSEFGLNNFKKVDTFKIANQQTTTTPAYSSKFDQRYSPLLSYNADRSKYVDIDSYLLNFDENGNVEFSVDQEIVVVDVENKNVKRILYYGPSFWVEDAFFKNDSVIILLENSNDRVPGYQEINLNTSISTAYSYKDTLDFDSNYYQLRVNEKLNENMKP